MQTKIKLQLLKWLHVLTWVYFTLPKDSPALVVFQMGQFSGTRFDKRELMVLWPAMLGK